MADANLSALVSAGADSLNDFFQHALVSAALGNGFNGSNGACRSENTNVHDADGGGNDFIDATVNGKIVQGLQGKVQFQ